MLPNRTSCDQKHQERSVVRGPSRYAAVFHRLVFQRPFGLGARLYLTFDFTSSGNGEYASLPQVTALFTAAANAPPVAGLISLG
jgi:hypothetical protein